MADEAEALLTLLREIQAEQRECHRLLAELAESVRSLDRTLNRGLSAIERRIDEIRSERLTRFGHFGGADDEP